MLTREPSPAPRLLADHFVAGVNLPWQIYGCDFGANAWQSEGGVSIGRRIEQLREVLAPRAAEGIALVRWFLFCDGRAGVARDADGQVAGVGDGVWRDIDAGLKLLDNLGQRALFVLFDFHWFRRRRIVRGAALGGGRSDMFEPGRSCLLERMVIPLLDRYGQDSRIAGWDLVNEPEWATLLLGNWNPFSSVRPSVMRTFIEELSRVAQAYSTQPVTVGLASPRGLPLVRRANLDLLQWHWYPGRARRAVPDPRVLAGEVPVLLGEFPELHGPRPPASVREEARALGYAGALAWSLLARDRYSADSSPSRQRG
jgi:hypothetical protein